MTLITGPLPEVARPSYREGQFLAAADFVAEQAYHRQAAQRHEVGNHTWGLVVGFDLVEVPDPADAQFVDVFLTPGLAIDGYGRQLVSFSRVLLDPLAFNAFLDTAYRSVWLQYAEIAAAPAPDGYADCADDSTTRVIETFRVVVDPVDETTDVVVDGDTATPEPAAGATIPADSSVPFQELPAEPPVARWLVRLGSLLWDGAARRFRPSGSGLTQGRRFAGVVAADVLAPAGTLRVAPRTAVADRDAADFAQVEGRLRVQGRVNAERELWMEGDPIRFTGDGGNEPAEKQLTLGRDNGPSGGKHRLRLTIGEKPATDVSFSVGTAADGATPNPVTEIRADGRVRIPRGPLDLGNTHRQEIELWSPSYALGTQSSAEGSVLYSRSPGMFAWYTGGAHSDQGLDPGEDPSGSKGTRRLVLDSEGSLDFGAVTHQMLKLWRTDTSTIYGIGVQAYTLYFRTDADFCWFRDGTHSDTRSSPGAGGSLAMKLDDTGFLRVFGGGAYSSGLTVGSGGNGALLTRHVNGKSGLDDSPDNLYLNWDTGFDVHVGSSARPSDLDVWGGLRVHSGGSAAVDSVVKVVTTDRTVPNGFAGGKGVPGTFTWDLNPLLDEVYAVFCVIKGFSVVDPVFATDPTGDQRVGVIPQNVWATVDSGLGKVVSGRAFCAQSDRTLDANNSVAITVIAIGRNLP
jgi:hypothetical protein